jgi:transposase
MRQRHFAGEKFFVDYASRTVPIYGAGGQEAFPAQLFIGALGASGYAYAEAPRAQTLPDWLASPVRALEYYGAAPTIFVPDNPKVGVTRADRYEPELQRSYDELAAHYGAVIIPARPYRPKDKSRAELSVLLVYRWILARLRHQRFFSLDELNIAIRPLLIELNDRPFQRLPGCRRSVFEALDSPAMRALPVAPYTYAEWRERTVAFDYHVDVDRHYYSVPHALVGHSVWTRYTASTVEIFFRSQRIATHVRSYQRGAHTTIPEHMPKSHRAHAEWSPRRLIQWGESIGSNAGAVVEHLLRSKPHPEQGYSRLPGVACACPPVRRAALRGRLPPGDATRQPHPQERQVNPRERAGPASSERDRAARSRASGARQRARSGATTTDQNDLPPRRRRH